MMNQLVTSGQNSNEHQGGSQAAATIVSHDGHDVAVTGLAALMILWISTHQTDFDGYSRGSLEMAWGESGEPVPKLIRSYPRVGRI